MRALVTGGAGFVGSALVDRLLAESHTVHVVDDLSTGSLTNLTSARGDHRRRFTFHRLDIRSVDLADVMARHRPEVVFHLAAPRPDTPARALAEGSVVGSVQVLEAARACGAAKVVFASSGAIYGAPAARDLPVRETLERRPSSPEGVAKNAVFGYLWSYRELYNLEFSALALANVYGPRQDPDAGVVSIFARRLLAGLPCTVFGDGSHICDFVYVDDVVDAFARAAERGGGLLLNVSTGTPTTVNHLHALLAAHAGVDSRPLYAPARPGEPPRRTLDPRRAALHLGWRPWTSLGEGTAAVIEALRLADAPPSGV
ncbi:MAG: NAD-dependent epimerase/dehydratase family protein [Acidimicrobiales bacterium]